jgi:maltoporin
VGDAGVLTRARHRLLVGGLVLVGAAAACLAVSPEDIQLYGYARSGIGANLGGGGDQVCFQLPGVGWKYRLGNECETYLEAGIAATLLRGDEDERFTLYTNLAYVVEAEADFEQFSPALREVWIEAEAVVGGLLTGSRLWAGKRFYRRHDVHINDFYFWDVSGPGAGVEDIDLDRAGLPGRLAVAVFRGVTDEFYPQLIRVGPDGEPELVPASTAQRTDRALTRLDLRVYELDVNPGGALTVGADVRFGTESDPDYRGRTGYGFNIAHYQEDAFGQGGFHKVVLQYGAGSAARLGAASATAVRDDGTAVADADPSAVRSFRLVDQLLLELDLEWSLFLDLVWEHNDDNDGLGTVIEGDRDWVSAGVRAVRYLTDHVNVAL